MPNHTEALNLNRLAYFAAVVDTGSFTKAAERLGITKAVVSQQITRLEAELKTSLLVRTTRRVEPTDAGRALHARCVMILREAEDAFEELFAAQSEPVGLLRVAASNDYGASVIAPVAAQFSNRYPRSPVELVLSDNRTDIVANQFDLTVRIGWLPDSSLQATRIGGFRQILVAAPDFAQATPIAAPEDLASLPFVANSALADPLDWMFDNGAGDQRFVRMRQTMAINSAPALLSAVTAGGGMAVLPDFLVADHLANGTLKNVLPGWALPSGGIHVVYPPARFRPPKVTAFVKMLVQAANRLKSAGQPGT